ncbi:MAG: hypothetical protein RL318_1107, partial [Fibrobacterota bacterium]
EAALEESPREPSLWMELGDARLQAGQAKAAAKAYQKALGLDLGREKAIRGLAQSLETAGDGARAMLEWRHLAQVSPESKAEAEAHIAAIMNAQAGGAPAAPVAAKSAAKMDAHGKPAKAPEKAPAHAAAPVKEGRNNAKQPALDKEAIFQKGLDLYRGGKKDAALEEFRKVLQKHPGHSGAYYFAGLIRNEKNDPEKARFNLSRAKDAFYLPRATYWLARIDEKAGKKAAAATGYRKALELGLDAELSADARKRLEAGAKAEPAGAKEHVAPEKGKPTGHEAVPAAAAAPHGEVEHAPPALPDTVRRLYSWNPPTPSLPAIPATDAPGKLFAEAAEKRKLRKYDDALEALRQLQVRHPNTPAAAAALLGTATIQYDMGLYDNAIASSEAFMKDNGKSEFVPQAQFLEGISQLRIGHSKDALELLSKLGPRTKEYPTEAQRLSAMAHAQSLNGKRTDAASTLRAAFGMEANADQKRGLALRAYREYQAIRAGGQALPMVQEALKGCDKSEACQRLSVAKADLTFQSAGGKAALEDYRKIIAGWPESPDAAWARYQVGTCLMQQGQSDQAAAAWREAAQSTSYWGQQAKFRLEEMVWRKSGSK